MPLGAMTSTIRTHNNMDPHELEHNVLPVHYIGHFNFENLITYNFNITLMLLTLSNIKLSIFNIFSNIDLRHTSVILNLILIL
jgi:hypothetical protein